MRTWLKLVGWVGGIVGAVLLAALRLRLRRLDRARPTIRWSRRRSSRRSAPATSSSFPATRPSHAATSCGAPTPRRPGASSSRAPSAEAGETVELRDEVLDIDGKRLPSPRACDPPTVLVHDPQSGDDVTLACSVEDFGERDFSVAALRGPPRAADQDRRQRPASGTW